MKYMGSKNRLAKYILPIILKNRKEGQVYVEPFCGGCNSLDKVSGKRIANDINEYLIATFKAAQNGWTPPDLITEEQYKEIQNNKDKFPKELVGYVGFAMSFGGKWFGGYRRDRAGDAGNIENMKNQSRRSKESLLEQIQKLKDVDFYNVNYWDLIIPDESIVYCDIPYQNSTKYSTNFDYDKFWNWAREISLKNEVFISEYNAPSDFEIVFEKELVNTLDKDATGSKKGTERLFKLKKI